MKLKWVTGPRDVVFGIDESMCDKIVAKITQPSIGDDKHVYQLWYLPTSREFLLEEQDWVKGYQFIDLMKAQEYYEKHVLRTMEFNYPIMVSSAYQTRMPLNSKQSEKEHQYNVGVLLEEMLRLTIAVLRKLEESKLLGKKG